MHQCYQSVKTLLSGRCQKGRSHQQKCMHRGVSGARWRRLPAHLSQWLHLNGFAPVCFLKCLVSSSLRAKRHSQPSHEHLYGFSPAEQTRRGLIELKFKHKHKRRMFPCWGAARSPWRCCHSNAFKSITPGGQARWHGCWQANRDPDSTEPVGPLAAFWWDLKHAARSDAARPNMRSIYWKRKKPHLQFHTANQK